MDEDLKNRREAVTGELQAVLAELESGDELTHFTDGHGLQSRSFAFTWSEPTLEIDFRLPLARVLNDEAEQQSDSTEIGVALRLAILLLEAAGRGTLLQQGESTLRVTLQEDFAGYQLLDAEGVQIDASEDLEVLIARLELASPRENNSMDIIWP